METNWKPQGGNNTKIFKFKEATFTSLIYLFIFLPYHKPLVYECPVILEIN